VGRYIFRALDGFSKSQPPQAAFQEGDRLKGGQVIQTQLTLVKILNELSLRCQIFIPNS